MNAAAPAGPAAAPHRLAAVVLNYRTPEQTLLAVGSLLASTRVVDDLIVVNNDSGECPDCFESGLSARVRVVHTGANLGFSGGVNAGIKAALDRGAVRVLLVNSDVIVPPDTLEGLEACLQATKGAGIAGPAILARSAPDTVASLGIAYNPVTGRMRHRGYGARGPAAGAVAGDAIVDAVSGCAMLVTRDVFDAIGLLDERYFFSFEDLDFCLAARRAGFATVLAGRVAVYHEGGQSIGAASPHRFYFAARNHLLVADRAGAGGRLTSLLRQGSIVALNAAHAAVSPGGTMRSRLAAVWTGTCDHLAGRYGAGPMSPTSPRIAAAARYGSAESDDTRPGSEW